MKTRDEILSDLKNHLAETPTAMFTAIGFGIPEAFESGFKQGEALSVVEIQDLKAFIAGTRGLWLGTEFEDMAKKLIGDAP